jgi:hypothetical protein
MLMSRRRLIESVAAVPAGAAATAATAGWTPPTPPDLTPDQALKLLKQGNVARGAVVSLPGQGNDDRPDIECRGHEEARCQHLLHGRPLHPQPSRAPHLATGRSPAQSTNVGGVREAHTWVRFRTQGDGRQLSR